MTPGFYKSRLVKGAKFSPVLIYRPCPIELDPETFQALDRWPHLRMIVDGEDKALPDYDLRVVPRDTQTWRPAYERWPNLIPISYWDYRYMIDDAAWARAYAPDDPAAQPRQAVDLGAMPPLF